MFFVSFSNSLNMKKIPRYSSFRLVKLNSEGLVTMARLSFSFLVLVKLTRMDSFEE